MKIIDFDAKFMDFVSGWIAMRPNIKPEVLEGQYNEMLENFLNTPAKWLDGTKPGEYFNRYTDPKDLMKLLDEYHKRKISLPEPLYHRIVELGAQCSESLTHIVENEKASEALRGTAMALLSDILDDCSELAVRLVLRSKGTDDEIGNLGADYLCETPNYAACKALLDRYEDCPDWVQYAILDICSHEPTALLEITDKVLGKLYAGQNLGLLAGILAQIGDERAVTPLMKLQSMSDLSYLDYIEVRAAIEALGADPGSERIYDGDAGYEALRNL